MTGEEIINKIVDRLTEENINCYDSAILNKLSSLSSSEINQLYMLKDVLKWHNDRIYKKSKENNE